MEQLDTLLAFLQSIAVGVLSGVLANRLDRAAGSGSVSRDVPRGEWAVVERADGVSSMPRPTSAPYVTWLS